jgi:hypothetical protein
MAYFSNGSEGSIFDEQCSKCRYGKEACPIAWAQLTYNFDACNNKVATDILDTIVDKDGICQMRKTFLKDFASDGSIQKELF